MEWSARAHECIGDGIHPFLLIIVINIEALVTVWYVSVFRSRFVHGSLVTDPSVSTQSQLWEYQGYDCNKLGLKRNTYVSIMHEFQLDNAKDNELIQRCLWIAAQMTTFSRSTGGPHLQQEWRKKIPSEPSHKPPTPIAKQAVISTGRHEDILIWIEVARGGFLQRPQRGWYDDAVDQ